ncbi:FMRFamide-related peptides-like isoform X2 [Prorops nasuta]
MSYLLFYGTVVFSSCVLVSSSILPSLRENDNLNERTFQNPTNDLEYVLKRRVVDARDEADSKERRSSGSSFIRFGRSESGAIDTNAFFPPDSDSKVSRHTRWKTPDIIITFGRSGIKTASTFDELVNKRGKGDQFIRFGRSVQILPNEMDLLELCWDVQTGNVIIKSKPLRIYLSRLCSLLRNIDGERSDSNLLGSNSDGRNE